MKPDRTPDPYPEFVPDPEQRRRDPYTDLLCWALDWRLQEKQAREEKAA